MIFSWKLFTDFGLGFYERQNPGTMLLLIAGMEIGVVGLAGLDHLPKDFQQSLAQTAQGASVAFAFRTLLPIVNFGPRANPHTALGPKMDGMAQDLVALVTDADPVNLAGLETDRRRAGNALQGLGILKAPGITADFTN